MKALVYTGPESVELREVEDPSPKSGESLIKVEAVGICGSDMHAYLGHDERRPAPLILGHEAAGTVVDGPNKGQRVTMNPLVGCGVCPACRSGKANLCAERQIISMQPRQGAFAEYVSIPTDNLVVVPEGVAIEKAALAEPIACGWHGARLAQDIRQQSIAGTRCLVMGGGAIGISAALSLQVFGADEIWVAETNPARRDTVAAAGPFKLYDPMSDPGPEENSVDIVIDGVGFAATRAAACKAVRPGGVIAHIGLGSGTDGLDIRKLTLQEITFVGCYTYTPEDFRTVASNIFDGSFGDLGWYSCLPLDEGAEAFRTIRAGQSASAKTILIP